MFHLSTGQTAACTWEKLQATGPTRIRKEGVDFKKKKSLSTTDQNMEWVGQKGSISPSVSQWKGQRGSISPSVSQWKGQRGSISPVLSLLWALVFVHCFIHTGAQFAKSSCKKCLSRYFFVLFSQHYEIRLKQKFAK